MRLLCLSNHHLLPNTQYLILLLWVLIPSPLLSQPNFTRSRYPSPQSFCIFGTSLTFLESRPAFQRCLLYSLLNLSHHLGDLCHSAGACPVLFEEASVWCAETCPWGQMWVLSWLSCSRTGSVGLKPMQQSRAWHSAGPHAKFGALLFLSWNY